MSWEEFKQLFENLGVFPEAHNCHDCNARPGEVHKTGCDVERCSSCGIQRLCCDCEDHDPGFARWTGYWPGSLEALGLGLVSRSTGSHGFSHARRWSPDMNRILPRFYELGLHKIFFVKPKV